MTVRSAGVIASTVCGVETIGLSSTTTSGGATAWSDWAIAVIIVRTAAVPAPATSSREASAGLARLPLAVLLRRRSSAARRSTVAESVIFVAAVIFVAVVVASVVVTTVRIVVIGVR